MKLEAPPSRYRVIERGGRLVVIDTVASGTPLKASDLRPIAADEPESRPALARDDRGARAAQDLILQTLAARPADYTASRSPVAQPPGPLSKVAATICNGKRDGDGRLQWTTARWFDTRGPRTVTLSPRAEPRLGLAVLALFAAAFCAAIFVVAFGFFGLIFLFIATSFARQAKPIATAWIDRLART